MTNITRQNEGLIDDSEIHKLTNAMQRVDLDPNKCDEF